MAVPMGCIGRLQRRRWRGLRPGPRDHITGLGGERCSLSGGHVANWLRGVALHRLAGPGLRSRGAPLRLGGDAGRLPLPRRWVDALSRRTTVAERRQHRGLQNPPLPAAASCDASAAQALGLLLLCRQPDGEALDCRERLASAVHGAQKPELQLSASSCAAGQNAPGAAAARAGQGAAGPSTFLVRIHV